MRYRTLRAETGQMVPLILIKTVGFMCGDGRKRRFNVCAESNGFTLIDSNGRFDAHQRQFKLPIFGPDFPRY